MIDLWPSELTSVDQKSPLTILKEQASLLGNKTQNIVIAELEVGNSLARSSMSEHPFKYGFALTCPPLGGYRFRLFAIGYGLDMYPVFFDLDSDVAKEIIDNRHIVPAADGTLQASNEEEFIETLKHIFSSRKALQVIRALLTQAKS